MDPVTIISTISSGLNLVDQFYSMVMRLSGDLARPGTIVRQRDGKLVEESTRGDGSWPIPIDRMNEFDQKRHDTLLEKIRLNWEQFNDIDLRMPTAAPDEQARLKQVMARLKKELCTDFKELVRLYENALGRGLPDHYSLYEICT